MFSLLLIQMLPLIIELPMYIGNANCRGTSVDEEMQLEVGSVRIHICDNAKLDE